MTSPILEKILAMKNDTRKGCKDDILPIMLKQVMWFEVEV